MNKLLIETWTFYRGNIRGICSVIMPIFLPIAIVAAFFGDFEGEETGVGFWLSLFVGIAIYPIYHGAMILYLASVVTGVYQSPKQYYKTASKFWLPLIVLYVCSSMAMLAGFFLFILPGLIVMGRLAFSEFYCVFHRKGGLDAFSLSWDASKNDQWLLVGGIIIIYVCISLPVSGLEYILNFAQLPSSIVLFVTNLISAALAPLVTIFAFRVYSLAPERLNGSTEA